MNPRALVGQLWRRIRGGLWVPPGHFYSPLPDPAQVRSRRETIFALPDGELPGIELDLPGQLARLRALQPLFDEQPFPRRRTPGFRYHFENRFYSYGDGLFLYAMLRQLRPRRYLEVGSGYSSALALDVRERYLDGEMRATFIDPHPERLRALLAPGDEGSIDLHRVPVQDAPRRLFSELEAGDVLFVDSTHVAKTGSDVNLLLFEILPLLAPGVHVHFHDLFFPFEYPEEWVMEGRGWNEAYLLRAFLQYNRTFEIYLWNQLLVTRHRDYFAAHLPLCLENPGGSLWLRRL